MSVSQTTTRKYQKYAQESSPSTLMRMISNHRNSNGKLILNLIVT